MLLDTYNRLKECMVMSKKDAVDINDMTDGELFENLHINSFTENPSKVNLEETLSFLKFKIDSSNQNDIRDVAEILKHVISLKSTYSFILSKELYHVNYDYLKDIEVLVNNNVIKLINVNISDIMSLRSQFISVFGDECQTQLDKLISQSTIEESKVPFGYYLTELKTIRTSWFDDVQHILLEDINDKDNNHKMIEQINFNGSTLSVLIYELIVVLLNSDKIRKDNYEEHYAVRAKIYPNKNKL